MTNSVSVSSELRSALLQHATMALNPELSDESNLAAETAFYRNAEKAGIEVEDDTFVADNASTSMADRICQVLNRLGLNEDREFVELLVAYAAKPNLDTGRAGPSSARWIQRPARERAGPGTGRLGFGRSGSVLSGAAGTLRNPRPVQSPAATGDLAG